MNTLELNKIICGDALEELKKLPNKSIDLILTDPPYNIDISKYKNLIDTRGGKKRTFGAGKRQFYDEGRRFHYEERFKWDKKEVFDLKEMSKLLFPEFDRTLKENGSLVIFGPQEWAYHYWEPAIQNKFKFKCQIIWIKTNPIPNIRHKNYRSAHENIIWFSRYNEKKCDFTLNFINQQEMKNVFEFSICGGNERENHPTQKPLKLIQKLIQIHSNENDIILDPFIGSGTTAVAAKMLGRNYIGIENNPEYVEIANNRIKAIPESLFTK